jgi:hypothetical protein
VGSVHRVGRDAGTQRTLLWGQRHVCLPRQQQSRSRGHLTQGEQGTAYSRCLSRALCSVLMPLS